MLAIAWGMNGIKKRSDIVSLEGAVACYLCMDGIKKRSDCVDQGLRGCGCLGLGHHLQEELSYIRDELHRHQNSFLDQTAQTSDYLPL